MTVRTGRMLLASSGWVDGRDAAEHPTMHREARTTQNYWAYNVNGAGAEKIVLTLLIIH